MMSVDTVKKSSDRSGSQEDGFIMIVTLLVLVVLTVLCLAALDNSTFEVQIAANDRQSRVAFNVADGSVYSAGKLLTEALTGTADPTYTGLSYVDIFDPQDPDYTPKAEMGSSGTADIDRIPNLTDDFYKRVFGFKTVRTDGKFDYMLQHAGSGTAVFVRIVRREAEAMAGGGAEFAAGAHGAGVGSGGGSVAVTFDLVAEAYSARNTRSSVEARYRKVLGAAGGL